MALLSLSDPVNHGAFPADIEWVAMAGADTQVFGSDNQHRAAPLLGAWALGLSMFRTRHLWQCCQTYTGVSRYMCITAPRLSG